MLENKNFQLQSIKTKALTAHNDIDDRCTVCQLLTSSVNGCRDAVLIITG